MVSSLILKIIQYGILIAMGIIIYSVFARDLKNIILYIMWNPKRNEHKRLINKMSKKIIATITLCPEIKVKAQAVAKDEERSLSAMIQHLLKRHIKEVSKRREK